jgi:hypothetical protein
VTAGELRNLLVTTLAGTRGGGRAHWRRAVADIKVYPVETHPHCNWEVRAAGSAREIAEVERAVDRLRADHPFVGLG